MRWVVAWSLLAVGACYRPAPEGNCLVSCAAGVCPSGLVCDQGLCKAAVGDGCDVSRDAAPADAAPDDALGDAMVDANAMVDAPGLPCYGSPAGMLRICMAAPTQPIVINTNQGIGTSGTPTGCTPMMVGGADVCVMSATQFQLTATGSLRATGSRPLVIVASGSILIDGTLDVAGAGATIVASTAPAGANPAGCPMITGAAGQSGGAGGSYGSVGGAGGASNLSGTTLAGATSAPQLRGGCRGGLGAGNTLTLTASGGGMVYLISATSIVLGITARIDASGQGGPSASVQAGGNGGGSGGLIGFDAPSITFPSQARVFANGGGGGGGGGMNTAGTAGSSPTEPFATAAGGPGNGTFGASGGNGAIAGSAAMDGSPVSLGADAGGGGGGGGVGHIVMYPASNVTTHGVKCSPFATSP